MVKQNNNVLLMVGLVIAVAVVASLITTGITANAIYVKGAYNPANIKQVYTKAEIDTKFSNVYTKVEIDALLGRSVEKPIELTKVVASEQDITIKTTIQDGAFALPILSFDEASGQINAIGKSPTQRLATSATNVLVFNATGGISSEYDGFVVSYASGRSKESYYLDVASVIQNNDAGRNETSIRNKITGDYWEDKKAGDTITLGNVVLTIDKVEYRSGGDRIVKMSANDGSRFDRVYTRGGLEINLPSENSVGRYGYNLTMREVDGAVKTPFKFELSTSSDGPSKYSTISKIYGVGAQVETISGSKIWESKVNSQKATKIIWDKTATSPSQYSAEIQYEIVR